MLLDCMLLFRERGARRRRMRRRGRASGNDIMKRRGRWVQDGLGMAVLLALGLLTSQTRLEGH